ncbi:glycosyltransferase [Winogradskyella helgolandensis]|uniref:glycosyltransferase n=1 Tax=Winogradskyella helgolandensis TaxID=2697010 RepID=UPI0015C870AB|nr:glycosyltransferase [Winogradskyella helgolandensis]
MDSKINILVAIPKLTAGGAERVLSFLAQNLNENNFKITFLIVGFEKDNKYDVSCTNTIYLNKNRVRYAIFSIVKTIKKVKPQIVLSSISDLNILMGYISFLFPSITFIGRHTFIISDNHKVSTQKKYINFDFKLFGLNKLDFFICQSLDMKLSIIKYYGLESCKLKVINNPITNLNYIKNDKKITKVKKYITIGRLSKLKGHIRILNILNKINHPFEFTIIGSGSFKDEIFKEVDKLNLRDKINYVEYTNNVYEYLVENDVFLQGSYSEGFPNALLESCAVGVPAIAFDVPGGTKEIISNHINGYLVNSEDEFIERLNEKKIWNHNDVKESVKNKFSQNIILKEYEDFFTNIIRK